MGCVLADRFPGLEISALQSRGASDTAQEIAGQPDLWRNTWKKLDEQKDEISRFLDYVFVKPELQIILTGAGTSAFVGDVLQGPFQKNTSFPTRSIATTDIVTHPENCFQPEKPLLLISFARSGNSPESVAAVNLANQLCPEVVHLIITCNADGQLAHSARSGKDYVFLLPPEADDRSLAMTGSFTSMLLAGILISRLRDLDELHIAVERISQYAGYIIENYSDRLNKIASLPFTRAVFLGSGPLFGIARESHLKLQELTDGRVICKYDSFLGFRHGPKAVIDKSTLLVFLFSNNEHANRYEADLARAIDNGEKGIYRLGVAEFAPEELFTESCLTAGADNGKIDEELWAVCSVLPAQIIGFFKSLHLGLRPDNPSENGAITRVVQGVEIYPYVGKMQKIKVK